MGPSVTFYVLQQKTEREAIHFACQLIEKISKQKLRVALVTGNDNLLNDFDKALWAFKPQSFVTHAMQGEATAAHSQVVLHTANDNIAPLDVWLALADTDNLGLLSFSRIVHIIRNDETVKAKARQHYKYYKDLGVTPETVTI